MICPECQDCIDFMGEPCLPQHGMPPHQSFFERDGRIEIGPPKIDPVSEWPANFVPDDPTDPASLGTWYCRNEGCENSKEHAGHS